MLIVIYILSFILVSKINYKKQQMINYLRYQQQLQQHQIRLQQRMYIKYLEKLKEQEHKHQIIQTHVEPPEFIKLNDLLLEFTRDHQWDNVIAIGDVYKNGAYPRFKSNKYMALDCYKVAAMSPDCEVAGIAQVKYIETLSENIQEIDNVGEDLPVYFGIETCNIAKEIINNTPYNSFLRPKSKRNNLFNDTITHPQPQQYAVYTREHNRRNQAVHVYKNDLQNVHDHSVTNIIKKNVDNLKKSADNITSQQDVGGNVQDVGGNVQDVGSNVQDVGGNVQDVGGNVQDVGGNVQDVVLKSIIEHPEISESVKGSAMIVLNNLNSKDKHGTFDVTETEALQLVWNKINNQTDTNTKSNMIEILAKQLDSGIENGHVVCSSGKISRIISTLDGIDDEMVASRPIWAIRDEIATLASKIRDGRYVNPQNEFQQQAYKLYINDLNLDINIINPIIEEYSEHL
jgi:hypothetical protein